MNRAFPPGPGPSGRTAAGRPVQSEFSSLESATRHGTGRRVRSRARHLGRWAPLAVLAFVLAMLATVLPGGVMRPTRAAADAGTKPRTDTSYYVTFSDPTRAYDLGCRQGALDATAGRVDSVVFLAFGAQNADNASTTEVNGNVVSYDQIARIGEAFAHGYWVCTGANSDARLFLSIATNNSGWQTTTAGGVAWGNLVNQIKGYVVSHYSQVVVLGGSDIEPAWATYDATLAWVNGYSSVAWQMYLNIPSADGCPTDTAANGSCDNGWTQADVWWLSYGNPLALAAPQIYYPVNAQQWQLIAQYGASIGQPPRYLGALDQYPSDPTTLDSNGAWSSLQNQLNSNPATASPVPFAMEVTYA